MKISTRQNEILKLVKEHHDMQISELSDVFSVSPQTMRKDINELCDIGLLRRLHGGVCIPSTTNNLSLSIRKNINSLVKIKIAEAVAETIPDGSSLFLGIGSTVEYVARALVDKKDLLVITNNLNVASILSAAKDVIVKIACGDLRGQELDIVGIDTVNYISRFYFDFGILGVGGLSIDKGLLDFDAAESHISRAVLDNSRCNILVADDSKWNRPASMVSGGFSELDIIVTNNVPEDRILKRLKEFGTKVIEVGDEL